MARVSTPVEGFNGVVAGVHFAQGVGETDDPGALAYFGRHGYTVERAEAPAFPDGDPSEEWKVDELKAYAKAHEIDLGEARVKADILAALAPKPPAPTA